MGQEIEGMATVEVVEASTTIGEVEEVVMEASIKTEEVDMEATIKTEGVVEVMEELEVNPWEDVEVMEEVGVTTTRSTIEVVEVMEEVKEEDMEARGEEWVEVEIEMDSVEVMLLLSEEVLTKAADRNYPSTL